MSEAGPLAPSYPRHVKINIDLPKAHVDNELNDLNVNLCASRFMVGGLDDGQQHPS